MDKAISNGNGSVQGAVLSTLKFIPVLKRTRKRHWTFRDYYKKAGLYIIIDHDHSAKRRKVVRIGKAKHCLYRAAVRFLKKLILRRKANYKIAFAEYPEGFTEDFDSWFSVSRKKFREELSKVPHPEIAGNYRKISKYARQEEANKDVLLSRLKFRPPFTGEAKNGGRARTFAGDYLKRAGVYVVKEREKESSEWIVAYVGRSFSQLAERMYHRFYKSVHKYLVEYSSKLDTHFYEVALIEVSGAEEIKELELVLIRILKPRDNIRGLELVESKPVWEEPGNEWLKPLPKDEVPF